MTIAGRRKVGLKDMAIGKDTEKQLAFGFGALFIVALFIVVFFVPNPTPFQYTVLRIVLALAAAGVAVTFTGFVEIAISGWIKAGGALAVFVIVFFYNPATLAGPLGKIEPTPAKGTADGNAEERTKETPTIPPGRLLVVAPFRARLNDCTKASCDVDFVLKGYDAKGRLRFDAKQEFKRWINGEFRDTSFNTSDRLFFEVPTPDQSESVRFLLYCKADGSDHFLFGSDRTFDWKPWNEKGTPGYGDWLKCGDDSFTASVGIWVNIATARLGEPAVRADPGPPK
jgi:hypothetical protein